jgi:hypothetical protein
MCPLGSLTQSGGMQLRVPCLVGCNTRELQLWLFFQMGRMCKYIFISLLARLLQGHGVNAVVFVLGQGFVVSPGEVYRAVKWFASSS